MIYTKKDKFYCETLIRVRYAEVDRMGYVYYGNYPTYFEVGRTEFLRELGLTYKYLEDNGYLLPVSKIEIKYNKPAIYDNLLIVRTIYKKFHTIRAEFDYEIYNEQNELLTTGYTLLVFVNAKKRKPTQAPQFFIDTIKKYMHQ